LAACLEEWVGDHFLAQRWQFWREAVAAAIRKAFWDERRGLFADDLAHKHFSEHTQCLQCSQVLLRVNSIPPWLKTSFYDDSLTRTTIYFNTICLKPIASWNSLRLSFHAWGYGSI
jgi:hypothetical protein